MLILRRANGKDRVEFISPPRTQRAQGREGLDLSSWSSRPLWLKPGFIHGLGGFGTEYRSVTLGNGAVWAQDCVVGGQLLLQGKVEKNRISPKTWYWGFFQTGKLERSKNQNDAVENERNRSLKFLQFPEKFSGGISTRGEDRKCRMQKAKG